MKIVLSMKWSDLVRAMTYMLDESITEDERVMRYAILQSKDGRRIMFFHSLLDGSANLPMLHKFLKLRRQGKATEFLCCNPEKIDSDIRTMHIMPNIIGEIEIDTEASRKVSRNESLLVLKKR